ncbi:mechanosensitive ion channel family protein [Stappia sp. WLB 29]|uniref:mechanosensitive ion channel family protein n=1 Tax=Stappia sp. WLB 29 TaxID=2925220 RepID=UPI0020C06771|nr:mechanosensitive ion channel family protein [Stappia sp. WLB 29]
MSKVSQRVAGGRRAGIFASAVAIAASAGAAAAQGATAMEMAADKPLVRLGLELRAALADTLGAAAAMPSMISAAIAGRAGDNPDWLPATLAVLAASLIAGSFALLAGERWLFARLLPARPPQATRAARISRLIARAFAMLLAIALFYVVALAVAFLLASHHAAGRVTLLIGLQSVGILLLLRIVLSAVLAPGNGAIRMLALDDASAASLYRWLVATGAVAALTVALHEWLDAMDLDPGGHRLLATLSVGLTCLLLSAVAVAHRGALGRLLSGGSAGGDNDRRRVLQRLWLPLLLLYFLAAFIVSSGRILLEREAALGLVAAPVLAGLIWAAAYGLMVLVIDRLLLPRLDSDAQQTRRSEDLVRAEEAAGELPDHEAVAAQAAAEAADAEGQRSPYRALLDHGAAILSAVIALGYVLSRWGIDPRDETSILGNLFEIGVVTFIAYMCYRAVELTIDRQIGRERGQSGGRSEDMEIGGVGESRLATLLPIFRHFLLITIVVIGGMIVLSQVGIDIAPLFAGAGVVGLAVGFGSQALIRDIFSGAFFLIDDAFRKGEYIDLGSVKGTVEKISIRSMQLRHHNGPLNTVPFGEIKHVKNFSRDWAVMKLAFRVTYDTDVEKMRKLIKKFGESLMQHPDYGPKFLQPVKSQGVTALEDSAMIVRVKFMTRPGDQFELRKVVYSGIRDLCEANGIHFAHREVTVRVAQDPSDPRQFSDAEKQAIAGAVRPLLEQPAATNPLTDASESR